VGTLSCLRHNGHVGKDIIQQTSLGTVEEWKTTDNMIKLQTTMTRSRQRTSVTAADIARLLLNNQPVNQSINQYSFNKSCQTQLKTAKYWQCMHSIKYLKRSSPTKFYAQ